MGNGMSAAGVAGQCTLLPGVFPVPSGAPTCPVHELGAPTVCRVDEGHVGLARGVLVSDLGPGADARLFAQIHAGRLLYEYSSGEWMVWAGHHWAIDTTGQARAGIETVIQVYAELARRVGAQVAEVLAAGRSGDEGQLELLARTRSRIKSLRTDRGRERCLIRAAECGLGIDGGQVDAKTTLLPCASGALDLSSGQAREGEAADLLVKSSPVEWAGLNAKAPAFERLLADLFQSDRALIAYVQRLLGACLCGQGWRRPVPVLLGGGSGRDLLVNTLARALGDLAWFLPASMVHGRRDLCSLSKPSPDVLALRGRRMVLAELGGGHLNDRAIRLLASGNPLTGRNPRDHMPSTFDPRFGLVLMAEQMPRAIAQDVVLRDKVRPVPLASVKAQLHQDVQAQDDAGVLSWLVRGALDYQQQGLGREPASIRSVHGQEDRLEVLLGLFLKQRCETGPDFSEGATQLYEAFKAYMRTKRESPPTQNLFGKLLSSRFHKEKKGVVRYHGLRIKPSRGTS